MIISEFEKRYTSQGGIKQLSTMREECETLDSIAMHFGVSKERVRQWMTELFLEKYDPRYERRKRRIEAIESLIKKNGIEKTKELYPGINKHYLKSAIKNIK